MKRFIITLAAILASPVVASAGSPFEEAKSYSYYDAAQSNTIHAGSSQTQIHGKSGAAQVQDQKAGNLQVQRGTFNNHSTSLFLHVDPFTSTTSSGLAIQGQSVKGHQGQFAVGGVGVQNQQLIQQGTQKQSGGASGSAVARW